MKELRSASQILFGFLPEQTVDLGGKVWKVKEWRYATRYNLDDSALRQELLRLAAPWEGARTDNGFCKHLRSGNDIDVMRLDRRNGVVAESFPDLWMCKACFRLHGTMVTQCHPSCKSKRIGQLPFVAYHDCGAIYTPYIKKCDTHKQVRVHLPGSSSAAEITFSCPECNKFLQKGFGFANCRCGNGPLKYNVHRASSVFTPRSVVIVNPPSPQRVRQLAAAGGPERALNWVLDGCTTKRYDEVGTTKESLATALLSQGFTNAVVARMVAEAEKSGELTPSRGFDQLSGMPLEEASRAAVTLAMALDLSRIRLEDLAKGATGRWADLARLYEQVYPAELARGGIAAVDLIDKFPILTGNYAYTRGDPAPGTTHLQPFRNRNRYVVYADVAETEALMIRLRPTLVAQWLASLGFSLAPWTDERSAHLSILSDLTIPAPGTAGTTGSVGDAILRLIHSFSHRVIRRASVFAGIDRNALSELLIPHHLSFVVYAAARGDFVLGGLQAVFETELHSLLKEVVLADHRCALDPGCAHSGGACMACLHIGEPSCRYFNQFLSRSALFGAKGYLQFVARGRSS